MKIFFTLLFMSLSLISCASKKKIESARIDELTTPMETYDPTGSDSMKIEGLHSIHFSFDRANLDKENENLLISNSEWMKKHPLQKIQIEGHCDQRGSIEYNMALGERRALAAKNFLVSHGVSKDRISVISYGKEKPLSSGDTEADFAQNRRDNFIPGKN